MDVIFQSLGGLGMFLFGIKIMSEGLQKVAGKKMRQTGVSGIILAKSRKAATDKHLRPSLP